MSTNNKSLGFGFIPSISLLHFLVVIPEIETEKVIIYERHRWNDRALQSINIKKDRAKVELTIHKWNKIADPVKNEFNKRLRQQKISLGSWSKSQIPVEKLFGKELVLLAWAIEDADPGQIPTAVQNWRGLSPEERWWLYTMTNAASGGLNDRRGWRKAIRYALTENLVDEKNYELLHVEITRDRNKQKKSGKDKNNMLQPELF